MTKEKKKIGKFLKDSFTFVGVIATLLGAGLGIHALVQMAGEYRTNQVLEENWVSESDVVNLADRLGESIIVANELVVPAGEFSIPDQSLWVANQIAMDEDSVVRATGLKLMTKTLRGGRIIADGQNGQGAGNHGGSAGNLRLLVTRSLSTVLSAAGGNGSPGTTGSPGPDGRAGRCDGFGKWRPAQAGGQGGRGQDGGDAGDGGYVVLAAPPEILGLAGRVSVGAGEPGLGGQGGPGGRGGRGCTGLGGAQETRANGPNGVAGSRGAEGTAGAFRSISIDPAAVTELLLQANTAEEYEAVLQDVLDGGGA